MHSKHLIVLAVGQYIHVMIPQLRPYEKCLKTTNDKKEKCGHTVHQTNLFVIDCCQPIDKTGCMLTRPWKDLRLGLVFSVGSEVFDRFSSHGDSYVW